MFFTCFLAWACFFGLVVVSDNVYAVLVVLGFCSSSVALRQFAAHELTSTVGSSVFVAVVLVV